MRLIILATVLMFGPGCEGVLYSDVDGGGARDAATAVDSGSASDSGSAGDAGTGADTWTAGDTGVACTPSCGSATCGSDGCGGNCGACAAGTACSAGQCIPQSTEGCPPSGPYGVEPGVTATNITLYDCDGNPVDLHSLCSTRVSYVFTFAEWCPNCRTFVREQLENEHVRFSAMGDLQTWVVLTATSGGGAVDAAACRRIRDSYELDTPGVTMLYDPTGETNTVLGMRINTADMVMKRNNEIVINGPWAWITVEGGLQRAFNETTP